MTDERSPYGIGLLLRVIVKGVVLFAACNFLYMLVPPAFVGSISLYNTVIPGRERFPFANAPTLDNNVTILNLNTMFASHVVTAPPADDEYRVFFIGDSATWGFHLAAAETYTQQINDQDVTLENGQHLRVYNLAFPISSATKDLVLLEHALQYEPDMVMWLVTDLTFVPERQNMHMIVTHNEDHVETAADTFSLGIDPFYEEYTWWDQTLIGQREDLQRLLHLHLYGAAWAGLRADHDVPNSLATPTNDFDTEQEWFGYQPGTVIDFWHTDVLEAVMNRPEPIMILVNEPVYIADGENSDLHYNFNSPRWAYDQYRDLLATATDDNNWIYYDWWDAIPPDKFIDPLHVKPPGAQQVSDLLLAAIVEHAE